MDAHADLDGSWSYVPECEFPPKRESFSLPSATGDVPIIKYLDSLVPHKTSHMDESPAPGNSFSHTGVPAGDIYASRVGRGLTSTRTAHSRRSCL